ncbi:MAG: hypothetical protein EZS28_014847 [Streblomastix strix]|uniref:SPRY domain-containing protein n=1 Tax=Streblomastix strix TaxID=222440 RepID=A0A5J4W4T7_9EUKA|nr:MAG: hypothetical protein EZS28_014847 [Streblomastix strix]
MSQPELQMSPELLTFSAITSSTEDVTIDGDTYTNIRDAVSTVIFEPVISSGIMRIEFSNIKDLSKVGLIEKSVHYRIGESLDNEENKKRSVRYLKSGEISHWGDKIGGNTPFDKPGERIALEVNMDSDPKTLTFYINDEEQPYYVTDLPLSVRFMANIKKKDDAFRVNKFEQLLTPTRKGVKGSRSYKWGKVWQSYNEKDAETKKKCAIQ